MPTRSETLAIEAAGSIGRRAAGRVGPNAIIQLSHALGERLGGAWRDDALRRAGLAHYVAVPPQTMIDQSEAARLFRLVASDLPPALAADVLGCAGRLTADYILAHRIPMPAQKALASMPDWLALRVLLAAIRKHAWTFAGSSDVQCDYGAVPAMTLAGNPLATAGCPWHLGVLGRLVEVLVSDRVGVRHATCCARGAAACRTEFHRRR